MRIVVTGAGGFIGSALLARLAATASAAGPRIEIVATDRPGAGLDDAVRRAASPAVTPLAGDIADPALLERLLAAPVDRVFHLAGVVSGAAEADFALGRRVNLDASVALLDALRRQAVAGGPVARFVMTSSIAVFGAPLPARIDDDTPAEPALSYGAHKRALELLIDDLARRGEVDGRALRLAGVLVRPPLPNGALSAFNSDLVREPLAGNNYTCPVGPDATLWVVSRRHTVDALERLAELPGEGVEQDATRAMGGGPTRPRPRRALTAPALPVSVRELVAAIGRADPGAARRVAYAPATAAQAALQAQFGAWPRDCAFDRARALGLSCDADADEVIRNHLQENT